MWTFILFREDVCLHNLIACGVEMYTYLHNDWFLPVAAICGLVLITRLTASIYMLVLPFTHLKRYLNLNVSMTNCLPALALERVWCVCIQ